MTDLYAAVETIASDNAVSLASVCDVLGVCRSAYYSWQMAEPGVRQRELDELTPTIVAIFLKHRRRYGARRIAHELRDRGIVCSPRRVAKVLKIQGLHAIQPRSFVPRTTQGRHALGYSPNLVLDRKDPVGIKRGDRLPGGVESSRDVPEHEPSRQLLRQRLHGIVLGNAQARTGDGRL